MTIKRTVSFILILTLVLSLTAKAFAAESTTTTTVSTTLDRADALKDLGLFMGTGNGFDLDRAPTRTEAVVMLLRMLGEETAAQNSSYTSPFTDVPTWAAKSIAFAYNKGYTSGTSITTFGSNGLVSPEQFFTFMLRALGYSDKDGDFVWSASIQKAEALGIIPAGNYKAGGSFTRGDCVNSIYSILGTNIKGENITLAKALIDNGTIKKDAASRYGFAEKLQSARVNLIKLSDGNSIISFKDLIKAVPGAKYATIWARPAELTNYTDAFNFREYKNIINPNKDEQILQQLTENSDVVNRYVGASQKMAIALYDENANMVAGGLYVASDVIAKGYIDLTVNFVNGANLITQMGSDITYVDTGIYVEINGPPGDSAMVYVVKSELPDELQNAVYFSVLSTNYTKDDIRLLLGDQNASNAKMINAVRIDSDAGGTKFTGGEFVVCVTLYDANGKAIGYSLVNSEKFVTNDPHFIYYRMTYTGAYQLPDGSNRPYTVKKYINGVEDTSFKQYLNNPYGSSGEPEKNLTIGFCTAVLFENSSVTYEVTSLDPSLNMSIEKKIFTDMQDYIGF